MNPRTIVVATVIVGVCEKVLNVPDCVKRTVGTVATVLNKRFSRGFRLEIYDYGMNLLIV